MQTALRALRREGDEFVRQTSRKSLKILDSVGEPINAAAWEWYYQVVGDERCPIVDEAGNSVAPGVMGKLVIKQPWPGMMQMSLITTGVSLQVILQIFPDVI